MLKTPKLRFKDKNGNAYPTWTTKRLIDLTDVRDGTHDSPKYVPFGYPLITSKNLNDNGKLNFSDVSFITKEDYEQINKRSNVSIGDILFGMIGTIGNPVMVSRDDFAIKNVALIKNNYNNFNRYLIYYLKTNFIQKQFYKEQAGGTQKFIALGLIRGLNINYPCLEEQEKIAGFLSKVDDLINECEGEVKDLEEQKKGLMQKIFSQQIRFKDSNNNPYPDWKEKKIKDISVVITGNTPKTSEQDNYGDKYLWCSPIDLGNEKYIKKTEKMLSEKGISKSRKIPKGSILVTCIGSTIGKIGFATEIMATNQQINSMLIKKENNEYIYYSLLYNFPKYMSFVSKQAVPIINKTQFENLKIDIPCLEEQEKIAKVLSKMDELIEEKKALLSDWQQFKKGLLQQMFV